MEYQLIVSPDFDLSPAEIITAWNADARATVIGSIQLAQHTVKEYDQVLIEGIVAIVSTVGVGILTNAIYDVLKAALLKKHGEHPRKSMKITKLDQPDGTHLLIVEQEE